MNRSFVQHSGSCELVQRCPRGSGEAPVSDGASLYHSKLLFAIHTRHLLRILSPCLLSKNAILESRLTRLHQPEFYRRQTSRNWWRKLLETGWKRRWLGISPRLGMPAMKSAGRG